MVTTDTIKISLSNLIKGDNYLISFILHNPTNKSAYLDRNTDSIVATSSNNDIIILLTKDISLTVLLLEVITLNLRTNKKSTDSVFLQCSGYATCSQYPGFSDLIP